MIKYSFNSSIDENINTYSFEAKGHAEYDEYGKDIVCAAVSILVVTLANRLNELKVKNLEISLIPGDFKVSCQAHVCDFLVRDTFEFVLMGMSLINTEHPECVAMEAPKKG